MKQKRIRYYSLHACDECGRGFRASRADARFCSNRCRQSASRAGRKTKSSGVTALTLKQLDMLAKKYVE